MTRSTARWATAFAAAALIALPAVGFAQPPSSSSPPQPTSSQSQPPSASASSQNPDTAATPAEHVRQAKEALSSIPQSAIPASDRTKFAQLRTHLNNLERDVNASSRTSAPAGAKSSSKSASASAASKWGTEVAAIDKILTDLIGPETGSAPATPPTGTETQATGTTGRARANATTLDEAAKDKLREVRRHVTELASAMSGTSSPRSDEAGASPSAANPDTMGSSSQSSPSTMTPPPTPSTSPATPPSTTPSSTEPSATNPQNPQAGNPAAAAAQSATPSPQQPQADQAAARQHLSEARDALSQITTLPEASRLQGEARTQVSQLISNFNELITTQSDWKAADAKVEANLNSLLGPDASSTMSGAGGTTGTTGSAAPTGTSGVSGAAPAGGSIQLDPAIRAKLVEFRTHLKEFEQAASGSAAASTSAASSVDTSPAANPATPAPTTNPPGAAPPSAVPSSPTPTTATPPTPTGTSGSTAAAPSATDMQSTAAAEAQGHAQADKELDAIQAILDKGQLSQSDVDQLKTHIANLRKLIAKSGKQ